MLAIVNVERKVELFHYTRTDEMLLFGGLFLLAEKREGN